MTERSGPRQSGRRKGHSSAAVEAMVPVVPVVGIGASAGGLEALEQFFGHMPVPSGLGFVVIQHMDPVRKGMLVELLQRTTAMPVSEITDRTRVAADHVYVIPPGQELSILGGVLHLMEPSEPLGLRHPIDIFFRALAEDRGEGATGVVLSGMGTDGTVGLRVIRERGGLVLVQDPASARFDGMPRSAVASGLADVVAPADQLPERLLSFTRLARSLPHPEMPLDETSRSSLEKIIIVLRRLSGNDFSQYKPSTLHRRIERRMGLHGIGKLSSYLRFLQEDPQEGDLLFRELLIGVTRFFRDQDEWERLRRVVLPELIAAEPVDGMLRAWVPACSTGEEAYSPAIVFREALEEAGQEGRCRLQVFATDLDGTAIQKARIGTFPSSISLDVTPERIQRRFIEEGEGFRVTREIRDSVLFAVQNVIHDPPFARLQILSCRNLLIYLGPELQQKLIPLFHHCIVPGGFLVLGNAETVGGFSDYFVALEEKTRIFRRNDAAARAEGAVFPAVSAHRTTLQPQAPQRQTSAMTPATVFESSLLSRFTPPAVLVGAEGDILHIHGHTGRYLEPAAGRANLNLFSMARETLRAELTVAFRKVRDGAEEVIVRGLAAGEGTSPHLVDITVRRLERSATAAPQFVVVFAEAAIPPGGKGKRTPRGGKGPSEDVAGLEAALKRVSAELRTTREEMQASHEDLLSANEELQSANEELQSTNEELLTSKEEMQSLNEELQTVNGELQAKVRDFERAEGDMRALLDSTDIATVFLDMELRVRRFTTQAAGIIRLIPGDVGRPITDVTSDLRYAELADDARAVLRSLIPVEKEVAAGDGRWFTARIRPYPTVDNRIDGVVVTFTDISKGKAREAELRKVQAGLEGRLSEQPGQGEEAP